MKGELIAFLGKQGCGQQGSQISCQIVKIRIPRKWQIIISDDLLAVFLACLFVADFSQEFLFEISRRAQQKERIQNWQIALSGRLVASQGFEVLSLIGNIQ